MCEREREGSFILPPCRSSAVTHAVRSVWPTFLGRRMNGETGFPSFCSLRQRFKQEIMWSLLYASDYVDENGD